ncbi:MAG: S8 family serine peptidase [Nanoarchaeota archaeon]
MMVNFFRWVVVTLLVFSQAVIAIPDSHVPSDLIATSTPADYLPGTIIISTSSQADLANIQKDYPFLKQKTPGNSKTTLMQTPDNTDIKKLSARLNGRPGVHAEPDYLATIHTDPLFPDQWALQNVGQDGGTPGDDIDTQKAWTLNSGRGIVVAVIDTGIDYTHPEFAGQLWVNPGEDLNGNGIADMYPASQGGDLDGIDKDHNCATIPLLNNSKYCVDDLIGYDFVSNTIGCVDTDCSVPDGDVLDGMGHGTMASGIIGARHNGEGIQGVCPNCKIMPIRACFKTSNQYTDSAVCGTFSLAQSIYYATDMGADVISMSLGLTSDSTTLRGAIAYAESRGVVVVASAGNSNVQTPNYPSAYSTVLAVASTDNRDMKAASSNFGTWIDVSAPGVHILTTTLDTLGGYAYFGGTSAAAPHVAGTAALVLSRNQGLTPLQVRTIIKGSTENINALNPSYAGLLGTGRLNAHKALCLVSSCTSQMSLGKTRDKVMLA